MEQAELQLLQAIEGHARDLCSAHDPAHDIAHVQRVVNNARTILAEERAAGASLDEFVVLAGGWLHDIVQLPKDSGLPGESARRSAEQALVYLDALGVGAGRARHIATAVRTHSFSGGERPQTIEAAIVQDADRLDALGAVGLARLFAVANEMRSQLYDPADPLAENRPLDDKRYALDHIATKLLKLPELMTTPTARQLARSRATYLIDYRDQFLREIGWEGNRE